MNWRNIFSSFAIAVLGLALLPGTAVSQQIAHKNRLVGTWTLVSNYNMRQDGTRFEPFGPSPKGILMFNNSGHFSAQLMRADRAKFASNNRMQATPEENKATVQNTLSFFGTYSSNDADHSFTLHIEGSSFPNWEGSDRKYILVDAPENELVYRSPPSSTGAAYAEVTWKAGK